MENDHVMFRKIQDAIDLQVKLNRNLNEENVWYVIEAFADTAGFYLFAVTKTMLPDTEPVSEKHHLVKP